MKNDLKFRERATIEILLFIVRLLNPTGYSHQVDELRKTILDEEK
jgi:hypothetical protein